MAHPGRGRTWWIRNTVSVLALFGLALPLSSLLGQSKAPAAGKEVATAVEKNPLDEPLAWLKEAKHNYGAIKDYTCTLVKKEKIPGKAMNDHIISFKFREQPFSVYMRWLAPRESANTEAAFVLGKNNNRMRVHGKGFAKVAGWVTLDLNDRRVAENSRHTIREAGIGNLIDHTIATWETERQFNKTEVKVAEYKYNNRTCLRVECTRTERRQDSLCYRSVLYLDKESKIPIRSEYYDWPRQGGEPDGELIEMFSFVDLRVNVGLTDRDFDK